MKREFQSIDEARIKIGKSCRECNQAIRLVPNKEGPVKYFPHHELTHGTKAFTIGYGLDPANDKLCYYHSKKKQGLFDKPTFNEQLKIQLAARR